MQRECGERNRKRGLDLTPPVTKQPLLLPSTLKTTHSLYQGSFPFYRLPLEIGHFSLDEKRQYHADKRRLRYFCLPVGKEGKQVSPGWDLMNGYESCYVKRNEEEKEGLLHILTWLGKNRSLLGANADKGIARPVDRDFVTWRGHLTKILCTPYETQEGWLLAVTLFKGTFYISEQETVAACKKRKERTPEQEKLMYSGYKFENYICADSLESGPDKCAVVNTNEAFCSVLLARLSSHSLLIAGEVDCIDPSPKSPLPPSCYIELKTSAQIRNPHQQRSFNRYKLLKWWSQSFLLGIPVIVAGFRSPEAKVVSIERFRTSDIPHLIRGCLSLCLGAWF
ncbi:hypothetical protein GDO86_015633 [Hymenochirus boettgeri]|uniref:Decapping nuclease n=1 Tax=Hymenochirus boettgeri TaxID=247094 RepID=A0A8T2JTP8_9PIPI|nr:hypothetical protein GDO86_015633 [Hymenochirus boettgeri]